ncbi:MAG: ABC transporter ATP-binding protein [Gemmatimonadetes bacterium]|nr:ABC transporter ATP-binding protein [Gemmatimonadota bacterium]
MIEFDSVSKRFSSPPLPGRAARVVQALREVTLAIPAGETWAVVGPNAAGKTTLFAVLLGFLHPSDGMVRIRGLPPRRYLRRHGAAYLPERFRLPGEWRVLPALRSLARLEGLSRARARRRADEVMERLELTGYAHRAVRTLSRGLLQRLGLAQALLAEHELMVLDEPTEGLDPLWRIRFRSLLEERRSGGATVLLSSHDLAEVERLAQTVVLLDGGRVQEIMPAAAPAGPQRYRLELASPVSGMAQIFPGSEPLEGEAAAYIVAVGDPKDLSQRLAALLSAGGVLVSARPVEEPLEARVERALRRGVKGS